MAEGIPLTRTLIPEDRAEAIRVGVRGATALPASGQDVSRLARPEDAEALLAFFSDPSVHAPIYSLPRPLTVETVTAFIAQHEDEREAGIGLLFVRAEEDGRIVGYSDLQIWPQWAAGELGGALHPDRQSQGAGGAGALATFDWMFETLDLDLICETSARDNIRTARLLERLGFKNMGEITSMRPDGTTRPSIVWEMTRQDWRARGD